MRESCFRAVMGVLMLASAQSAVYAQKPTDAEQRRLPPYCQVKYKYGTDRQNPQVAYWRKVLGEPYAHVHHYCNSLNWLNRSFNPRAYRNERELRAILKGGLDDVNYMLARTDDSYVLRPEMYLTKGRLMVGLKQYGEALQLFGSAIRVKPDYAPAYAAISDVYKRQGDVAQAREIIEKGLRQAPNSKYLKRRLERLDSVEEAEAEEVEG